MNDEKNPQTIESPEEEHTQSGPSCRLPASGKGRPMTRRDFLGIGLSVLGAIAVLEVGGASALFLQSRSKEGKFGSVITAGAVESFQPGSVTEFIDGRFFLIRTTDGGFLAVHTRCPHLGCTVMWVPETNKFLCPCHASHFDAYGNFEGPPVPRPLDTFGIVIEEGLVKVDTSHLHQRQDFTPDQLSFA